MASTLAPPKPKTPAGGPPSAGDGGGFGGNGGGPKGNGPGDGALAIRRYKTGMWLALGAVVMVFAAFSSAYVVRKGVSNDWRSMELPSILWFTTAVLLASSVSIELSRRREGDAALRWLAITSVLGAVFLGGQYMAWQQLAAGGVYLSTNPSSSFFYLLTGAHGVHLVGGVAALAYVALRAWVQRSWSGREAAVQATALYWHFMDGLWVYVFLLLHLGR